MPAPVRDLILTPEEVRFRISAEPVFNALQSMVLLSMAEELSGLDDWIVETARELPEEVMQKHILIMFGLHYAVIPKRSFDDFEAYLKHLETVNPRELRDQLLDMYLSIPPREGTPDELIAPSKETVLKDVQTFLTVLRSRFDDEVIDEKVERPAFELLRNPKQMRSEIVDHLSMMWKDYLEDEFQRRQPMIDETVAAFNKFDLQSMNDEEAVRFVTGQWNEKMSDYLSKHEQIVFVPSPHTGPYSRTYSGHDTLWVIFNCRLPEGAPQSASRLSRAELLVWLSALADDTRLQILTLLKEHDELCAQDIIPMLETSQSTASRHLRQLNASGYIHEQRKEAGKCYRLNTERFRDTINALETFLV